MSVRNRSLNFADLRGFRKLYVTQGESVDPRIGELRRTFLSLVSEQQIELNFVPSFATDDLRMIQEPKTIVTTDPLSVKRADCLGERDVLVFFAIPPGYPNQSKEFLEWSKSLQDVADYSSVIFTNSNLSRRIIESVLSSFRADVQVLRALEASIRVGEILRDPKAKSLPLEWDFDVASELSSATSFEYGGSDWSGSSIETIKPSLEAPKCSASSSGVEHGYRENLSGVLQSVLQDGPDLSNLKVGVIGTKLTFIDELVRDLERNTGADFTQDAWRYLSGPPSVDRTLGILADSDVVIGEWARPNNKWIQERADDKTRLIVRAHRYEVTTDFPRMIDMERYSAGVVIVPWVGRKLVQEFGWPAEKMVYIPNYINSRYFDREKLPGARFTLGLVGITPSLKRLDLALELLSRLRRVDTRYTLRVRGALPPTHINWGVDPAIEAQWSSVLYRLEHDESLVGAVHFDDPGRDMGAWFERVGIILSTSDLEGSHVALAEGMASGALPVVRDWPGARTLWPSEIIHSSLDSAVAWVLRSRDSAWFSEITSKLKAQKSLDSELVLRAWTDLLGGDIEQAKARFGPIGWNDSIFEPLPEELLFA